ncbi:MAG: flagellar hook-length control protein FliK [Pseudomonadota bacterium]
MSQLPLIPSTQGAKALAQPAESSVASQALDSEGQVVSSTFIEAMQEVLESSASESLPGLGWTVALPMGEGMTPYPMLNGSILPGQSAPGGNPLPFQFAKTVSSQSEMIKPGVLPESPTGLLVEKLIGQADRSTISSVITPSTEGILQAIEPRSGAELTGQVSLTAVQALNSTLPGRSAQLTLPVDVPVGQPGWDKAVGERIQWMIGSNIQNAEVKLTPPHLGPLEIRISVQNDQASVSFIAAQLPTREALEAALPRLREMFGEANLNLVDVDVSQGGGSDSNKHQEPGGELHAGSGMQESTVRDPQDAKLTRLAGDGIVDDYA